MWAAAFLLLALLIAFCERSEHRKPPLPGEVAARLRAGRKGFDGPPAASRPPPLNSFHTVFHNDVENSYFSTVHNRLYLGQK